MESKDQTALVEKLESQVEEIYKAVAASNEFMWPALLRPGKNLTARLLGYSMGTPAHMQMVLQYSYASWVETPGAIDMIRELSKKHSGNQSYSVFYTIVTFAFALHILHRWIEPKCY